MSLTRECATSSADILRKQVGGTLDVLKVATLVHGVYVRTPVVWGALPAPYMDMGPSNKCIGPQPTNWSGYV